MHDFLSGEHRLMQKTARELAHKVIAPVAAHHDETGEFPLATVRKLGEMGFMGIEVPAEWGGAGLDTLSYAIALIEVSKADASHGTIMSVNNSLYCQGLMQFGSDLQRETFLRPVASGEKIGAFSLTEPMSGSDASTMKSRAVLSADGSHYVIHGVKSWVTSAPFADFIVLYTMTDAERKHRGVTAFLIDTTQPGFARGKTEPKMGIRASATSEIVFDGYRCPVAHRLGGEGGGFKIAMSTLDGGRIGIAAQAVGIAEAALEASIEYAKEREAFGQKIGEFQMIQQKLADMKCRVEASRLLVYNAAMAKMRAKETGGSYSMESSMAKLYASEAATWVANQAIQVHGGMGYSRELPLERYFRDAKITEIYEGTSEIQRLVISRALTGLR
ncbi:MAG TPA: acyl-CoA dehydrogenase family protein [Thermoanaerobaculia bacterium]|nr:acyl-CoA dehydrogenase family protein [Thermoanaerobaculia bacterium]